LIVFVFLPVFAISPINLKGMQDNQYCGVIAV